MFTEIVFEIVQQQGDALADPQADDLSDHLLAAGALSVTVEDADAGLPDEQPLFGEPGTEPTQAAWHRSRIVALFEAQADIDSALTRATQAAGLLAIPQTLRRPVENADWVRMTQAQFEPIHVGQRLWIVPSWHQQPAAAQGPDAIVLQLDPGLAFGTGSHPTTRLCLAWLEAHLIPGQSVIDYGCGSGILAIAAKKLGAGSVIGTDIDAQAITASIDNARENQCSVDFIDSTNFHHASSDIVVANILSNPLKVLAPLLSSLVADGGALVLSGVLERQWQEVAEVYRPLIELAVWRTEDDWVCLHGRRAQARIDDTIKTQPT